MPIMKIFDYRTEKLSGPASAFFSLLLWLGVAIFTTFFFLMDLLIFFPLSFLWGRATGGLTHLSSRWWARSIIASAPIWNLQVRGQGHIRRDKRYVIIANHQSLLDILAVAAVFPLNFKFLAKKELFYVPVMGWAMALAGYIPVNRSSHESGKRAIFKIAKYLRNGASVLLFPEGTRSPDGKIHAFKMGAFKLAREAGCEILPVVIDGTAHTMPKKSLILKHKSTFIVSVGKPVSLANLDDRSLEDVKEQIRHEMMSRLAHIRHKHLRG